MEEKNYRALRFHKNGRFKIMQVADVQDTQNTSSDTIRFLSAALDAEEPDLVVFTGDQLKGYGLSFKGGNSKEKVKLAIKNIVMPVVKRDIPFAVTFGNHDSQAGVDKEGQLALYQQYPQCITPCGPEGLPGCGNDSISIYGSANDSAAFHLYILDSLEYDGGIESYACVSKEQIAWCKEVSGRLKADNAGKPVPSLLFQHIPVPEIYEVMTKAKRSTKGAVLGNRNHREYYVLGPELLDGNSFMKENAAAPVVNNGQFEAWLEQGDVLGAYFGHDHNNCFVGRYKGIDLGYTPGCGFNVYGPGLKRAVRIFELDETKPEAYRTYPLFYQNLLGHRVEHPLKCLLYTYAPSSIDAAKPMIAKGAAALGILTATAALIHKLRK